MNIKLKVLYILNFVLIGFLVAMDLMRIQFSTQALVFQLFLLLAAWVIGSILKKKWEQKPN